MSIKNIIYFISLINIIKTQTPTSQSITPTQQAQTPLVLQSISFITTSTIRLKGTVSKIYIYINLKSNQITSFKYKLNNNKEVSITNPTFHIELKATDTSLVITGQNRATISHVQIANSLKISPYVFGYSQNKLLYSNIHFFRAANNTKNYIFLIYKKTNITKNINIKEYSNQTKFKTMNKFNNLFFYEFKQNTTYNTINLDTLNNYKILSEELTPAIKTNLIYTISNYPLYKVENVTNSSMSINLTGYINSNFKPEVKIIDYSKNVSTDIPTNINNIISKHLFSNNILPNNIKILTLDTNNIFTLNRSKAQNVRIVIKITNNIYIESLNLNFISAPTFSEKGFITSIVFICLYIVIYVILFFYHRSIFQNKDKNFKENENKQVNKNMPPNPMELKEQEIDNKKEIKLDSNLSNLDEDKKDYENFKKDKFKENLDKKLNLKKKNKGKSFSSSSDSEDNLEEEKIDKIDINDDVELNVNNYQNKKKMNTIHEVNSKDNDKQEEGHENKYEEYEEDDSDSEIENNKNMEVEDDNENKELERNEKHIKEEDDEEEDEKEDEKEDKKKDEKEIEVDNKVEIEELKNKDKYEEGDLELKNNKENSEDDFESVDSIEEENKKEESSNKKEENDEFSNKKLEDNSINNTNKSNN